MDMDKEYTCSWCGQVQTKAEMDFDEHDQPRYCFMCGKEIEREVGEE